MSSALHKADSPPRRLSVRDYMALDDDAPRCELLEGELVMAPAPNLRHQHVVTCLTALIQAHVSANNLGYAFTAPLDVVLFDDTVVQPDVLFVSAARFETLYDGHGLTGAPDLVVEVLSPGTSRRDRAQKRDLYLRAGVAWLLLVEPTDELVEVFERTVDDESGQARYRLETTATGEDVLRLEPLPGLELALGAVWFDPGRFASEKEDESP